MAGPSPGGGEFLSMSRFAAMSFDEASSVVSRSQSTFAPVTNSPGQRSFRLQRRDSGRANTQRRAPDFSQSNREIARQRAPEWHEEDLSTLFRFPQDVITAMGGDGAQRRVRTFIPRPQSRRRARDDGFDEYQALQMLDEDVVKRGVSDRKLRSLDVRPVTRHKAGDDKCNICQFEYRDGEKVMHLPCKHQFHPDCIKGWFKENRTCPVCRYEVEA